LRPEIYVTAALVGAAAFTLIMTVSGNMPLASLIGLTAAFVVRGGALRFGWTVPTYRARPGRDPDEMM
jgi:uncharacterized membrane protein YeiH